jgi:5-methylcytosine-specific restriction endonuclease McrA
MSIISQKLRDSAGHPDAENKQKVIHATKPTILARGRVAKQCHCGMWFELPACHAPRHNSCTATCAAIKRAEERNARRRACIGCGAGFVPRPQQVRNGGGNYCSLRCSTKAARDCESRLPALIAAAAKRRGLAGLRGEDNPRWTGGQRAAARRRIESGKANEYTRQYRAKNPEKVREWRAKRRGHGRLPRGTIKTLRGLQKNKCAYCRACLDAGFHVDHIKPLSAGGLHEPGNVQLLCPTCNVRKWATDPIEFAQRNGRLL